LNSLGVVLNRGVICQIYCLARPVLPSDYPRPFPHCMYVPHISPVINVIQDTKWLSLNLRCCIDQGNHLSNLLFCKARTAKWLPPPLCTLYVCSSHFTGDQCDPGQQLTSTDLKHLSHTQGNCFVSVYVQLRDPIVESIYMMSSISMYCTELKNHEKSYEIGILHLFSFHLVQNPLTWNI
jgi:hypothetical protein